MIDDSAVNMLQSIGFPTWAAVIIIAARWLRDEARATRESMDQMIQAMHKHTRIMEHRISRIEGKIDIPNGGNMKWHGTIEESSDE